MGVLAFVAAFVLGTFYTDLEAQDIALLFPGDLFVLLVGVTYLFAIAQRNGTITWLVGASVRAVGGRLALIPWVVFVVAGTLTAVGAVSPAAVAILAPLALGVAARYGISQLLMGLMVVHGAQAGGFSPISIYGVITNSVMAENNLPVNEVAIFLTSLLVNLAIALVLFFALGGRQLASRRVDPEETPEESSDTGRSTDSGPTDRADGDSASATPTGGGGTVTETRGETTVARRRLADQVITLIAFAAVAFVALVFERNIGFAAITAAVILTALFPKEQKGAIKQIAWSTVLLVAGVSTFATILNTAGAPEAVGMWAAGLGTVLIGALVLCYVGGITSAFASSTALLPIIVPISIPLIATGDVSAVAVVAALAVASTIVDVSPFSTNGALMVANRPDTISEEKYYKQVLYYSVVVTLAGPLLVWAAIVVPGWI